MLISLFRKRSDSTTYGCAALDEACSNGHIPVVKAILGHGADVTSCDDDGYGALHHVAEEGQEGAIHALIDAGADVDLAANDGVTPLIEAAYNRVSDVMLALLRHGVTINVQDEVGDTPLHAACSGEGSGAAVAVDILLRWGADETALDSDSRTPMDKLKIDDLNDGHACPSKEFDHVRSLLAHAPADRNWRCRCLVVMLRSRSSRLSSRFNDGGGGDESVDASGISVRSDGRAEAGKMTKTGGLESMNFGICGQAVSGGSGAGSCDKLGRLSDLVAQLVGLDSEGLVRKVVSYL